MRRHHDQIDALFLGVVNEFLNRMTDHRIGLTNHQLAAVMEGQLQPTIDALIAHYTAEKLKAEAVTV